MDTNRARSLFFKRLSQFLSVLIVMVLLMTSSVYAITPEQKKAIQLGARYYNTEACDDEPASTATPTSSATGPVFVIGDSIGVGMQNAGLEQKLADKSLTPAKIDVTTGITLASATSHLDNPDTQSFIKTAVVGIIELGTNPASEILDFNSQVNAMVGKIKAINPNIRLYWINIGSTSSPAAYANRNSVLNQIAPNNFTLIDWTNQNIPLSPDGLHPTAEGYNQLADHVANSVGGSQTAAAAISSSGECCVESPGLLAGDDNRAKIWNFLVSKGLSAPQTAGVMGNLQAESGFNPAIVEGGSGIGFGIAQWSFGRRTTLENEARAKGVDPADLAFQLEFLFNEAQGRKVDNTLGKTPPAALGAPNEWEGLKLMQTVPDATVFWHAEFEVSNDDASRVQNRVNLAEAILLELGSTTTATTAAFGSSSSGCSAGVSGNAQQIVDTAIKLSWPEPGHGLTPKPEYAAAVQQFNASAPYNGADCGAFVGIVMRMSGADPEYAIQQTKNQENYVRAHPEKFDIAEDVKPADLQPGDILIVNQGAGQNSDGHTLIYLGPQPNGYSAASASGGKRMPNLGNVPTVGEFVAEPAISSLHYIRVRLK